jgi:hypothetical protein
MNSYLKTIIQNPNGLPPETLQDLTLNLLAKIKEFAPSKADKLDLAMFAGFIASLILGVGAAEISAFSGFVTTFRSLKSKDAPPSSHTAQESILNLNTAVSADGVFKVDGILQLVATVMGVTMKKYSEAEESSILGNVKNQFNKIFGKNQNPQMVYSSQTNTPQNSQSTDRERLLGNLPQSQTNQANLTNPLDNLPQRIDPRTRLNNLKISSASS